MSVSEGAVVNAKRRLGRILEDWLWARFLETLPNDGRPWVALANTAESAVLAASPELIHVRFVLLDVPKMHGLSWGLHAQTTQQMLLLPYECRRWSKRPSPSGISHWLSEVPGFRSRGQ